MAKKIKKPKSPIGMPLAGRSYRIEDGVTQGLLGSWVNCRKHGRYYLDGWRRIETKESLTYGGLFHDLLENLYEGVRSGDVGPDEADDGDPRVPLRDYFKTAAASWRRKTMKDPAADIRRVELCLAQASAVFPAYCEYWEKEDFRPGLWMELEGVFNVEWRGFRLRGRRDGVQRPKTKKGREFKRLVETKTKSQIVADEIDLGLVINFQNRFYLTALNAELQQQSAGREKLVTQVLYNIVRRPGLKFNPDKESLDGYAKRCEEAIAKEPEKYFLRTELTYTREDQEAFGDELEIKLGEFKRWLDGDLPTYGNQLACITKWSCGWLRACCGDMSGYARTGRLFNELED